MKKIKPTGVFVSLLVICSLLFLLIQSSAYAQATLISTGFEDASDLDGWDAPGHFATGISRDSSNKATGSYSMKFSETGTSLYEYADGVYPATGGSWSSWDSFDKKNYAVEFNVKYPAGQPWRIMLHITPIDHQNHTVSHGYYEFYVANGSCCNYQKGYCSII